MIIKINSRNYSIEIVDDNLSVDDAISKALVAIEKLKTVDGLPDNEKRD